MVPSDLMEQKKALLQLLIIIVLCISSYVLSLREVPLAASLKSFNEAPSVQEFAEQGLIEERYHKEVFKVEEGFIRGRMDVEDDYPGTGANNHHDPKNPGRS